MKIMTSVAWREAMFSLVDKCRYLTHTCRYCLLPWRWKYQFSQKPWYLRRKTNGIMSEMNMISKNLIRISPYTGHTQKNGAVLIVFTIKTAPSFCVCPVLLIYITTLCISVYIYEYIYIYTYIYVCVCGGGVCVGVPVIYFPRYFLNKILQAFSLSI
jgi:hypothetical protein